MLRLTTAIIIATYMLLNSCSVTATTTTKITAHTTGEISLVLMGLVVDKNDQKPINAATIILIDKELMEKEKFETKDDGSFQFRLEAGKNYIVTLLDAIGNVIDEKTVSTVNKSEPEIMHTMFETDKHILSLPISDEPELEYMSNGSGDR